MIIKDSKKTKIKKILYKIFIGETIQRKLFLFYLYAIILGMILLSLPISLKNPSQYVKYDCDNNAHPYTFLDIFFTSISAFTDTGLTTLVPESTFSWFGELVILLLIQVGGLGLFTLYWCVWQFFYNNYFYKKIKKISFSKNINMNFFNSMLISSERGNTKLGLTNQTIKYAVLFIFCVEIIFSIFYSIMFAYIPAYEPISITTAANLTNPETVPSIYSGFYINSDKLVRYYKDPSAIWVGIFHSISTINNAGFDIIGSSSLIPYRNDLGTILQFFTILQIFIGGIGYPIIYDIIMKIKSRKQKFKLSLFTKVGLISYFVIFIIGFIFLLSFELGLKTGIVQTLNNAPESIKQYTNKYFGTNKNWNIFCNILFNTFSSRSAGFATISQSQISDASKWIMIILMFIGCSPSSTGGGIRTTTLAIIFALFVSKAKGQNQTTIFKKAIPHDTIITSFLVFTVAVILVTSFSLVVLPFWDTNFLATDMFFEFMSAFGTVGLSAGITNSLLNTADISVIVLCIMLSILMVIGQLGIPSTLLTFKKQLNKKISITYAYEDIKI